MPIRFWTSHQIKPRAPTVRSQTTFSRSTFGDPGAKPQPIDEFLIEEQIMPDYENVITD